jgi:hypothetical protein
VKDSWGNPVKTTEGNTYKMRPGGEYLKDPLVTVLENSEDCWLFIKLEETGGVTVINGDGNTVTYGFDDYLAYTVADAWTQLYDAGHFGVSEYAITGVYYRYVPGDAVGTGISYRVLEDDTICVQPGADAEMLKVLDGNGEDAAANSPRLSCTAYAVQHRGFEAEICSFPVSGVFGQVFNRVFAFTDNFSCLFNAFDCSASEKLNGDVAENGCFNRACNNLSSAGAGGHFAKKSILCSAADNVDCRVGFFCAFFKLFKR